MSMDEQVCEALAADRRLVILRLLLEYGGGLNTGTLEAALRSWGLRYIDRAMIRDDCRWLAHRGLVATQEKSGHLIINLLAKGQRCAEGQEMVDGIAIPSR